ncbi:MAG: hypothetical protein U9Q72_00795 [Patescibacteria group bacterium]|nr:hypothetical protein [Patescibacteria group bacterium]
MSNLTKKIPGVSFIFLFLLLTLNGCGFQAFQAKQQPMEKLSSLENKIQESANAIRTGVPNTTLFEDAVNQKDYEGMEGLLADEVNYIVEASDCCGNITRDKAIAQLREYLRTPATFNFSQEQQIVKKLKVNIADRFENYTVGIASGKAVLAYKVNPERKVDDIYVVGTYELFDIE